MSKFNVGDRIAVYTGRERFTGTVEAFCQTGAVFVTEDGFYSAHRDAPFHPKQCRKLSPKPKRRRIWACQSFLDAMKDQLGDACLAWVGGPVVTTVSCDPTSEIRLLEFVERKKRQ